MSTEFRHRFDMNGNDVGAYVDLRTSRAQNFSRARAVDFYVFCGKSERESESSTCFPCKKNRIK